MMTISKYFKEEEDFLYRVGQKKGRSEERAKAEKEKKQMALKLKAQKISLEIIADATGLTIEEIKAL